MKVFRLMTNNVVKTTLMLFFLFLIGCNNKGHIILNDNLVQFSKFPKTQNISFKEFINDTIGVPAEFNFSDSTMFVFNNYRNKYYFYNYSFKNNLFSKEYIKRGKGPDEVLLGFCSGLKDNYLWVYDSQSNKILTINKNTAIDSSKVFLIKSYNLKKKFYKTVLLDSNYVLGIGNIDSKYKVQKVALKNGEIVKEFGEFQYIPKEIPFDVCKNAYQSNIYIRPSADKIVLPYRFSDVIEIYDIDKGTSIAIQGIDKFDVNFNINKSDSFNMERNEKTRLAFLRGGVTNDFIFLLYSGRLSSDENCNTGRYVFVYDWDGNPIKKIVLDREINTLGVSKDGKTLYSYDHETGYILKANLN
ncbi:TolB-like 6-blade propeller-like [Flavobacterium resistens]|uniref:TolB-like 6-blade propeller-like n=1 Tax=Flavobacterium resistens TaxID=443612 RepID=A0A521FBE9_9FLAO|nr:BF3164 family lipoprotein [Flavobacterium resistens]MRX70067.1 hypothetical protein [Flavobacterium resistens]SMO92870.1 TolB-like 6-blade propeller-like [Flavobacterium resistens]